MPFWVGIGLIVAGLGVLAYVGWQFYGTNIVAHQKQQKIVDETVKAWDAEGGAGASGQATGVELNGASALIKIPRFGKNYVMPVQEGVSDRVLAEGFGHFKETVEPGRVGNYALAAHRVTHGEPLRDMPKLRPGDEIVVETKKATYTYELDTDPRKLIVTFADVWVIDTLPKQPQGRGRAGAASGPEADHADHLRGAVPHRQPDDRLRAPGRHHPALTATGCARGR